jgi:glycosyltransferase involved in cell wall biosynthesis
MTPDRIVMIGTDPQTRGGIASVLAAWEQAGLFERWPVTYIPTHRDGSRLAKALRALDAAIAFAWLAFRVRCAVLHVHGASRASFWRKSPFMAVALAIGWPVVFHLHGGGFAAFYERECGPLRRAVVRFFFERAARIVVLSDSWGTWVRATFAHVSVACVPNAVPLVRAEASRSFERIAFVGRLTRDKGAFDLLEAVALLRDWRPAVRVELAGEGDVDALARYAHALGIGDRVLIRGWCAPAERGQLLARSGLFVLPSHAEGLPMSLLEAMAAGCAVVASRVGGIPDVVRDGTNGLLVRAGDPTALAAALVRLLANRPLASRLARAGRDTVARRHSPAVAVDRIGHIYSELGVIPAGREQEGRIAA